MALISVGCADAADGFYHGLATDDAKLACAYSAPGDSCPSSVVHATGKFVIGKFITSGTMALVAATGDLCFSGSCDSNSNPSAEMPADASSFGKAWETVETKGSRDGFSPIPCVDTAGGWYVAIQRRSALGARR
jgi:hypothetical protein